MDKDDQEELDILRGRIIALERTVISLLALIVGETGANPAEMLKAIKQSLQNNQRPIDPRSDAAWHAAVEALEQIFASASARATGRNK